ncbi:acetate/propionate family kinase [Prosthecomicrobium sp. N25]|uniref:acetate/propionate family kinase n=1 Tax=Prosthecomicrobium sp. N25 TaxID=3129254 RepID=UPI0030774EEC
MDTILVVNAGSSSVKFQVFGVGGGSSLTRLIKGQMDGIGVRPRLRAVADGSVAIDQSFAAGEVATVPIALARVGEWLRRDREIDPVAVGHRVVHGGPDFDRPVFVDAGILARLTAFEPLAPLHQPNNLAPIRSLLESRPDLPQVACFDTGFHRGHDALADHYAIPLQFYDKGVRRYGFHGLSYEYVAGRLAEVAPDIAQGRVIVAHLGSGASMCALREGRSLDSTMGFTALDGLPMGTRPGNIDPGVILYLIEQEGMSASDVQAMLYRDCGLKGLSGISNDVRDLLASADPRARFALDYFCHRIALSAGMLTAALGGLDAFVFTAGIGENAPAIREDVVRRLGWVGASLDPDANAAGRTTISGLDSRVAVMMVPTDEEMMIARHTAALVGGGG